MGRGDPPQKGFVQLMFEELDKAQQTAESDKEPAKEGDLVEKTGIFGGPRGYVKTVSDKGAVFFELDGHAGTFITLELGSYRKINPLDALAREAAGEKPPGLFDRALAMRERRERQEREARGQG